MYGYYNFLNVLKNIIGELCDFLSSKDIIKFIHTYMYVVFSSICHFQILVALILKIVIPKNATL